jgi:hypothetical protein
MFSAFLDTYAKLREGSISFVMSVRPSAWNNWAPTGRIFMKFGIWVFFQNLSRKFKFHLNLTRITDTLHEDLFTFMIIFCSVLLGMRNVSEKSCRENQETHFMFNKFFFPENRAVYEIMWQNIVQPDRPQMTILYGACALHAG